MGPMSPRAGATLSRTATTARREKRQEGGSAPQGGR